MASKKGEKKEEIFTISTPETLPPQNDQQTKFWKINKEMLRFKVHYFFFCAAIGTSLPYLTIFAQASVGISSSALAAILTAKICISTLGRPSIGYLADYFNKLKAIICILAVMTTTSFFLLLALPKIDKGTAGTSGHVSNGKLCETLFISEFNSLGVQENDTYRSAEIFNINDNSRSTDRCLPTLTHFSSFLKDCSDSNKRILESASKILEDNIDLEQKYIFSQENTSSQTDYISCEACCKQSRKCITIECQTPKTNSPNVSIEGKPINDFQAYQYWIYAVLATICMTCINSFTTLSDTACCETVQKSGAQFGRQRLWGAIGWGLLSPASGFLLDLTGGFLASWIMMAILTFIFLTNMIGLRIDKPQFSKNLLKDIGNVLASKEFLAFMFCALLNGVGAGIMLFYVVIFLTDIGGSRLLCGLVNFVQCFIGEIPFMFFSDWAIRKWGHFNLQTSSMLAYCVRFFWYSQLQNPWFVLPAEVLHGFTYGLFYPSVASFAKLSSKPGTEATTQAVLFATHEGIGVGIGCIVTGIGFDTVGNHATFLYTSIFFGISAILSIGLTLLVRQQKGNINKTASTAA